MRISSIVPLKLLFGVVLSAMIAGVVLALAIPAYDDYTIRSMVTSGANAASGLMQIVSEFQAREGRWPIAKELPAQSVNWIDPEGIYSLQLLQQGIIEVHFFPSSSNFPGFQMRFVPHIAEDGRMSWNCTSTAPRLAPPFCRNGPG